MHGNDDNDAGDHTAPAGSGSVLNPGLALANGGANRDPGVRRRLSPELVQQIETHVRELAEAVGLAHWHITIDPVICDEDEVWARTQIQDYNAATIQIGQVWIDAPPHERTVTLLHELLHCPVYRLHHVLESIGKMVAPHLPPAVRKGIMDAAEALHEQREEEIVEGLARAIADLVPVWGEHGETDD